MNQRQYAAASQLSEEQLKQDQKAFFKSIHGTLNHILVGDIIWLKRFASHSAHQTSLLYFSEINKPPSLNSILFDDFTKLRKEREKVDTLIINWVTTLTNEDLNHCITYKNMAGEKFNKPMSNLISHLFMHQTHHRAKSRHFYLNMT
jgi:uncharacterized damage-inducible protein DinB